MLSDGYADDEWDYHPALTLIVCQTHNTQTHTHSDARHDLICPYKQIYSYVSPCVRLFYASRIGALVLGHHYHHHHQPAASASAAVAIVVCFDVRRADVATKSTASQCVAPKGILIRTCGSRLLYGLFFLRQLSSTLGGVAYHWGGSWQKRHACSYLF